MTGTLDVIERLVGNLLANLHLGAAFASFLIVNTLAQRRLKVLGYEPAAVSALTFWLGAGALVGARLVYLLPTGTYLLNHPVDVLFINAGLSWYGALAGTGVALYVYGRRHTIPTLYIADAYALFLPLGNRSLPPHLLCAQRLLGRSHRRLPGNQLLRAIGCSISVGAVRRPAGPGSLHRSPTGQREKLGCWHSFRCLLCGVCCDTGPDGPHPYSGGVLVHRRPMAGRRDGPGRDWHSVDDEAQGRVGLFSCSPCPRHSTRRRQDR